MATRLYFTALQTFTVPADPSWEQTANAVIRVLSTVKPTAIPFASTVISKSVATNPGDILMGQFISGALQAQTITGDVKGIIRALESAASTDAHAQTNIRVVTPSGTTRGTLLAHDASALTSEFSATTLTNRKFPLAWAGSGTALSSVAAEDGDLLVIEVGFRGFTASGPNCTLELGGTAATDLAEDETSTTQLTPWFEFSADLLFQDFSGRMGEGTDLLTQLGKSDLPTYLKAESYADGASVQDQDAYPEFLPSQRSSRMDPMRIEAGGGIAIRPFGYYGDFAAVLEGSVPSLRDPRETVNFTAGSAATQFYKMRALANPGPGYLTWVVMTTPDFAGAQAPGAIQGGTAVVADAWLEV